MVAVRHDGSPLSEVLALRQHICSRYFPSLIYACYFPPSVSLISLFPDRRRLVLLQAGLLVVGVGPHLEGAIIELLVVDRSADHEFTRRFVHRYSHQIG